MEPVSVPKLSGTNNVPIVRSRYQPSVTPIAGGTDGLQQDHVTESKHPPPDPLTRQARHERGVPPERVS